MDEWYVELAEMHISQLIFQQNGLVTSEDDYRNKYISPLLFRRLAKQGRLSTFGFKKDDWPAQSKSYSSALSSAPSGSVDFRFWRDDFRAGNALLDETDEIAAIID